jgi:hypothetical protein
MIGFKRFIIEHVTMVTSDDKIWDSTHVERKLATQPKLSQPELQPSARDAIHNVFTSSSEYINRKLLANEPFGTQYAHHFEQAHRAVVNNATEVGHEYHLVSGVSERTAKNIVNMKDNLSKVHTSTTTSMDVAKRFADKKSSGPTSHIIHFKVLPSAKLLHIGNLSQTPHEDETVIPYGSKMTFSHTTEHHDGQRHYKMHHVFVE